MLHLTSDGGLSGAAHASTGPGGQLLAAGASLLATAAKAVAAATAIDLPDELTVPVALDAEYRAAEPERSKLRSM